MQKIVLHNSQLAFHRELERLLSEGYTVVPGTFYATSLKMRAQKDTPPDQIDPEGCYHRFLFMAAVTLPLLRPSPSGF